MWTRYHAALFRALQGGLSRIQFLLQYRFLDFSCFHAISVFVMLLLQRFQPFCDLIAFSVHTSCIHVGTIRKIEKGDDYS